MSMEEEIQLQDSAFILMNYKKKQQSVAMGISI